MTDRIQFLIFCQQTKKMSNKINLFILSFSRKKRKENIFTHLCKTRNVSVAEMSENHHVDGVRFYDLPWNFFFSLFLAGNKTINKDFFGKKKKFVKSKHYINCGTRILKQRGKKFLKHYLYFNHHLCSTTDVNCKCQKFVIFNLKMTTKI